MKILMKFKKFISIITTICLVWSFVVAPTVANAMTNEEATIKYKQIFKDFMLPYNYGQITSAHYAGTDRVIINIQDLHCHPKVQENISNIIEIFDKSFGVKNVYLEGVYGQLSTKWISDRIEPSKKVEILKKMLDTGRLTGAEYYSLVSGKTEIISGLEEKIPYLENLKRFGEIVENQEKINVILNAISESLAEVKKQYYTKRQYKLEELSKNYREGTITPQKYYALLSKHIDKLGIDLSKYENTFTYMSLLEMQKTLDYSKITNELQNLILLLRENLANSAYQMLVDNTENFSKIDKLYGYIVRISRELGLDLTVNFPNLDNYFGYIEFSQKINPLELIDEEKRLTEEINTKFSETKVQMEVVFLTNFERYLRDYVSSKITASDYEYYKENIDTFRQLWNKYVDNKVLSMLDEYIAEADKFYKINTDRNIYFTDNMFTKESVLGKLENEVEAKGEVNKIIDNMKGVKEVDVVITGGFHSQTVTEILKNHGVSYIVITPNVTDGVKLAEETYYEIAKEQSKISFQTLATLPFSAYSEEIRVKAAVMAFGVDIAKELFPNSVAQIDTMSLTAEEEKTAQEISEQMRNIKRNIEESKFLESDDNDFVKFLEKISGEKVGVDLAKFVDLDELRDALKYGQVDSIKEILKNAEEEMRTMESGTVVQKAAVGIRRALRKTKNKIESKRQRIQKREKNKRQRAQKREQEIKSKIINQIKALPKLSEHHIQLLKSRSDKYKRILEALSKYDDKELEECSEKELKEQLDLLKQLWNISEIKSSEQVRREIEKAFAKVEMFFSLVGYSAPQGDYDRITISVLAPLMEEISKTLGKERFGILSSPTASKGSIDATATVLSQMYDALMVYVTATDYLEYVEPDEFPNKQTFEDIKDLLGKMDKQDLLENGTNLMEFMNAFKFVAENGKVYSEAVAKIKNVPNFAIIVGGRAVSIENDLLNAYREKNEIFLINSRILARDNQSPAITEKRAINNSVEYLLFLVDLIEEGVIKDVVRNKKGEVIDVIFDDSKVSASKRELYDLLRSKELSPEVKELLGIFFEKGVKGRDDLEKLRIHVIDMEDADVDMTAEKEKVNEQLREKGKNAAKKIFEIIKNFIRPALTADDLIWRGSVTSAEVDVQAFDLEYAKDHGYLEGVKKGEEKYDEQGNRYYVLKSKYDKDNHFSIRIYDVEPDNSTLSARTDNISVNPMFVISATGSVSFMKREKFERIYRTEVSEDKRVRQIFNATKKEVSVTVSFGEVKEKEESKKAEGSMIIIDTDEGRDTVLPYDIVVKGIDGKPYAMSIAEFMRIYPQKKNPEFYRQHEKQIDKLLEEYFSFEGQEQQQIEKEQTEITEEQASQKQADQQASVEQPEEKKQDETPATQQEQKGKQGKIRLIIAGIFLIGTLLLSAIIPGYLQHSTAESIAPQEAITQVEQASTEIQYSTPNMEQILSSPEAFEQLYNSFKRNNTMFAPESKKYLETSLTVSSSQGVRDFLRSDIGKALSFLNLPSDYDNVPEVIFMKTDSDDEYFLGSACAHTVEINGQRKDFIIIPVNYNEDETFNLDRQVLSTIVHEWTHHINRDKVEKKEMSRLQDEYEATRNGYLMLEPTDNSFSFYVDGNLYVMPFDQGMRVFGFSKILEEQDRVTEFFRKFRSDVSFNDLYYGDVISNVKSEDGKNLVMIEIFDTKSDKRGVFAVIDEDGNLTIQENVKLESVYDESSQDESVFETTKDGKKTRVKAKKSSKIAAKQTDRTPARTRWEELYDIFQRAPISSNRVNKSAIIGSFVRIARDLNVSDENLNKILLPLARELSERRIDDISTEANDLTFKILLNKYFQDNKRTKTKMTDYEDAMKIGRLLYYTIGDKAADLTEQQIDKILPMLMDIYYKGVEQLQSRNTVTNETGFYCLLGMEEECTNEGWESIFKLLGINPKRDYFKCTGDYSDDKVTINGWLDTIRFYPENKARYGLKNMYAMYSGHGQPTHLSTGEHNLKVEDIVEALVDAKRKDVNLDLSEITLDLATCWSYFSSINIIEQLKKRLEEENLKPSFPNIVTDAGYESLKGKFIDMKSSPVSISSTDLVSGSSNVTLSNKEVSLIEYILTHKSEFEERKEKGLTLADFHNAERASANYTVFAVTNEEMENLFDNLRQKVFEMLDLSSDEITYGTKEMEITEYLDRYEEHERTVLVQRWLAKKGNMIYMELLLDRTKAFLDRLGNTEIIRRIYKDKAGENFKNTRLGKAIGVNIETFAFWMPNFVAAHRPQTPLQRKIATAVVWRIRALSIGIGFGIVPAIISLINPLTIAVVIPAIITTLTVTNILHYFYDIDISYVKYPELKGILKFLNLDEEVKEVWDSWKADDASLLHTAMLWYGEYNKKELYDKLELLDELMDKSHFNDKEIEWYEKYKESKEYENLQRLHELMSKTFLNPEERTEKNNLDKWYEEYKASEGYEYLNVFCGLISFTDIYNKVTEWYDAYKKEYEEYKTSEEYSKLEQFSNLVKYKTVYDAWTEGRKANVTRKKYDNEDKRFNRYNGYVFGLRSVIQTIQDDSFFSKTMPDGKTEERYDFLRAFIDSEYGMNLCDWFDGARKLLFDSGKSKSANGYVPEEYIPEVLLDCNRTGKKVYFFLPRNLMFFPKDIMAMQNKINDNAITAQGNAITKREILVIYDIMTKDVDELRAMEYFKKYSKSELEKMKKVIADSVEFVVGAYDFLDIGKKTISDKYFSSDKLPETISTVLSSQEQYMAQQTQNIEIDYEDIDKVIEEIEKLTGKLSDDIKEQLSNIHKYYLRDYLKVLMELKKVSKRDLDINFIHNDLYYFITNGMRPNIAISIFKPYFEEKININQLQENIDRARILMKWFRTNGSAKFSFGDLWFADSDINILEDDKDLVNRIYKICKILDEFVKEENIDIENEDFSGREIGYMLQGAFTAKKTNRYIINNLKKYLKGEIDEMDFLKRRSFSLKNIKKMRAKSIISGYKYGDIFVSEFSGGEMVSWSMRKKLARKLLPLTKDFDEETVKYLAKNIEPLLNASGYYDNELSSTIRSLNEINKDTLNFLKEKNFRVTDIASAMLFLELLSTDIEMDDSSYSKLIDLLNDLSKKTIYHFSLENNALALKIFLSPEFQKEYEDLSVSIQYRTAIKMCRFISATGLTEEFVNENLETLIPKAIDIMSRILEKSGEKKFIGKYTRVAIANHNERADIRMGTEGYRFTSKAYRDMLRVILTNEMKENGEEINEAEIEKEIEQMLAVYEETGEEDFYAGRKKLNKFFEKLDKLGIPVAIGVLGLFALSLIFPAFSFLYLPMVFPVVTTVLQLFAGIYIAGDEYKREELTDMQKSLSNFSPIREFKLRRKVDAFFNEIPNFRYKEGESENLLLVLNGHGADGIWAYSEFGSVRVDKKIADSIEKAIKNMKGEGDEYIKNTIEHITIDLSCCHSYVTAEMIKKELSRRNINFCPQIVTEAGKEMLFGYSLSSGTGNLEYAINSYLEEHDDATEITLKDIFYAEIESSNHTIFMVDDEVQVLFEEFITEAKEVESNTVQTQKNIPKISKEQKRLLSVATILPSNFLSRLADVIRNRHSGKSYYVELQTEKTKKYLEDKGIDRSSFKGTVLGVWYEMLDFWKIFPINTTVFGKNIEIESFIEEHENPTMAQIIAIWVIRALSIGLGVGAGTVLAVTLSPFAGFLGIPTLFATEFITHLMWNLGVQKIHQEQVKSKSKDKVVFRNDEEKPATILIEKNGKIYSVTAKLAGLTNEDEETKDYIDIGIKGRKLVIYVESEGEDAFTLESSRYTTIESIEDFLDLKIKVSRHNLTIQSNDAGTLVSAVKQEEMPRIVSDLSGESIEVTKDEYGREKPKDPEIRTQLETLKKALQTEEGISVKDENIETVFLDAGVDTDGKDINEKKIKKLMKNGEEDTLLIIYPFSRAYNVENLTKMQKIALYFQFGRQLVSLLDKTWFYSFSGNSGVQFYGNIIMREFIKNAVVHGNLGDLSKPIYLRCNKKSVTPGFSVYNTLNRGQKTSEEILSFAAIGEISGMHVGLSNIRKDAADGIVSGLIQKEIGNGDTSFYSISVSQNDNTQRLLEEREKRERKTTVSQPESQQTAPQVEQTQQQQQETQTTQQEFTPEQKYFILGEVISIVAKDFAKKNGIKGETVLPEEIESSIIDSIIENSGIDFSIDSVIENIKRMSGVSEARIDLWQTELLRLLDTGRNQALIQPIYDFGLKQKDLQEQLEYLGIDAQHFAPVFYETKKRWLASSVSANDEKAFFNLMRDVAGDSFYELTNFLIRSKYKSYEIEQILENLGAIELSKQRKIQKLRDESVQQSIRQEIISLFKQVQQTVPQVEQTTQENEVSVSDKIKRMLERVNVSLSNADIEIISAKISKKTNKHFSVTDSNQSNVLEELFNGTKDLPEDVLASLTKLFKLDGSFTAEDSRVIHDYVFADVSDEDKQRERENQMKMYAVIYAYMSWKKKFGDDFTTDKTIRITKNNESDQNFPTGIKFSFDDWLHICDGHSILMNGNEEYIDRYEDANVAFNSAITLDFLMDSSSENLIGTIINDWDLCSERESNTLYIKNINNKIYVVVINMNEKRIETFFVIDSKKYEDNYTAEIKYATTVKRVQFSELDSKIKEGELFFKVRVDEHNNILGTKDAGTNSVGIKYCIGFENNRFIFYNDMFYDELYKFDVVTRQKIMEIKKDSGLDAKFLIGSRGTEKTIVMIGIVDGRLRIIRIEKNRLNKKPYVYSANDIPIGEGLIISNIKKLSDKEIEINFSNNNAKLVLNIENKEINTNTKEEMIEALIEGNPSLSSDYKDELKKYVHSLFEILKTDSIILPFEKMIINMIDPYDKSNLEFLLNLVKLTDSSASKDIQKEIVGKTHDFISGSELVDIFIEMGIVMPVENSNVSVQQESTTEEMQYQYLIDLVKASVNPIQLIMDTIGEIFDTNKAMDMKGKNIIVDVDVDEALRERAKSAGINIVKLRIITEQEARQRGGLLINEQAKIRMTFDSSANELLVYSKQGIDLSREKIKELIAAAYSEGRKNLEFSNEQVISFAERGDIIPGSDDEKVKQSLANIQDRIANAAINGMQRAEVEVSLDLSGMKKIGRNLASKCNKQFATTIIINASQLEKYGSEIAGLRADGFRFILRGNFEEIRDAFESDDFKLDGAILDEAERGDLSKLEELAANNSEGILHIETQMYVNMATAKGIDANRIYTDNGIIPIINVDQVAEMTEKYAIGYGDVIKDKSTEEIEAILSNMLSTGNLANILCTDNEGTRLENLRERLANIFKNMFGTMNELLKPKSPEQRITEETAAVSDYNFGKEFGEEIKNVRERLLENLREGGTIKSILTTSDTTKLEKMMKDLQNAIEDVEAGEELSQEKAKLYEMYQQLPPVIQMRLKTELEGGNYFEAIGTIRGAVNQIVDSFVLGQSAFETEDQVKLRDKFLKKEYKEYRQYVRIKAIQLVMADAELKLDELLNARPDTNQTVEQLFDAIRTELNKDVRKTIIANKTAIKEIKAKDEIENAKTNLMNVNILLDDSLRDKLVVTKQLDISAQTVRSILAAA